MSTVGAQGLSPAERRAMEVSIRRATLAPGLLGENVWLACREWAEERERSLREALEFYADPDTYAAIGMAGDPPCGAFLDDLDDAHDPGCPKPGKRARAALASPTPQEETDEFEAMIEERKADSRSPTPQETS